MYKPPTSSAVVLQGGIDRPKPLDNITESQKIDNIDSVRSSTTSQVNVAGGLISGRSDAEPTDM